MGKESFQLTPPSLAGRGRGSRNDGRESGIREGLLERLWHGLFYALSKTFSHSGPQIEIIPCCVFSLELLRGLWTWALHFVCLTQEDPKCGSSPKWPQFILSAHSTVQSKLKRTIPCFICHEFLPIFALIESPIYAAPCNSQAAKLFHFNFHKKSG